MTQFLPFKPKYAFRGKDEDHLVWSMTQQKQDNCEQPPHAASALSLMRQLHLCIQGQGLRFHYLTQMINAG